VKQVFNQAGKPLGCTRYRGVLMNKWLLFATAMLLSGAAHAGEKCALHQLGVLNLKERAGGAPTIPVLIDGKPQAMAIDVSDPNSFLTTDYGDAQNFDRAVIPVQRDGHLFIPKNPSYLVTDFMIGNIHGTKVPMHRFERPNDFDDDIVGEVGADILSGFDMEVDLKNGRVILFSQDHCPGDVVYWTKSEYAAIPLDIDPAGHSSIQMKLDGKTVSVAFELAATGAFMSMKTAKRIFDIDENSEGVTPITEGSSDGPRYRFPFKALSINGISISNPKVDLDPSRIECRLPHCFGGSDLYLGVEELKYLHLYFAFKEKMLYVTPADAH
jgi:hypothetical protein